MLRGGHVVRQRASARIRARPARGNRTTWARKPHPPVPSPGFEPGPTGSEPAGSAVGLEGHGAADRVRSGDLDVGNVALYLLSYNRMEPPRGIEPRTSSLPKDALVPTELRRQVVELTGLESNQRTRGPKPRCPCHQSTGQRSLLPDPNRQPSAYRAAALPVAPRRQVPPASVVLRCRCEAGPAVVILRCGLCARPESNRHDLAATDPSSQ